MSTDGAATRRLLSSILLIVAVPTAVVTCQARTLPYYEGEIGGSSDEPMVQGTGGATAEATASGTNAYGAGGLYGTTTHGVGHKGGMGPALPPTTGAGGTQPATTTVVLPFPDAGRVFLGQYAEPPQVAGEYYVPAPPATATVARPCEERQEVCAGVQTRESWAKTVIAKCVAETKSTGCVDFIFDNDSSCSKYVVYWNGANQDLGRCVATIDYYESCSGPNEGANATVITDGPACLR